MAVIGDVSTNKSFGVPLWYDHPTFYDHSPHAIKGKLRVANWPTNHIDPTVTPSLNCVFVSLFFVGTFSRHLKSFPPPITDAHVLGMQLPQWTGVIPGTSKDMVSGTHTIPILFPYYSHIFRDSGLGLGNSMGKGSHYWGVPENPTDKICHHNHRVGHGQQ